MTIHNTNAGGFEGLHQILARKDAEIEAQKVRIKELEDEMSRILCLVQLGRGRLIDTDYLQELLSDYEPSEEQQGLVPMSKAEQ